MAIFSLKDQEFESHILKEKGLFLVDFWAEWCSPCLELLPKLEEVSEEMEDQVKIFKMNVEESPRTPIQYGVRSIPTLVLFKDGTVLRQKTGNQSKEELLSFIKGN